MKHLGDIKGINGRSCPPVDVITGGSPCQDLSVAGRGTGLAGERSGLFREQMRIVSEMYEEFDGIGGFPLCWPGETVWSSEIAEFPLAVLKARFGEDHA